MALYHKYRPDTFEHLLGNKDIVSVLQTMLADGTVPHAILLHGPTGCGKTTIARILGAALESGGTDLREYDSADFRGIDTIRDIRKLIPYAPAESACQVWILDECHKLTPDAQSALLKTLEDTPDHVYFILCTTDPQKLIPTIKGRCEAGSFLVERLTDKDMSALLRKVVGAEGQMITKAVSEQIILDSMGHPRNALGILEKVLAAPPETRLAIAQKTAEESSQSIDLCRALMRKAGWKEVALIISGMPKADVEKTRLAVMGYCQSILLKGAANKLCGKIMEDFETPFYNNGMAGLTLACFKVVEGD